MKNKQRGILKKAGALMTALLMLLAAVPASFAASADWTELEIILSWFDANGEEQRAAAVPTAVTETGEGCFWAMVAPDAPLDGLIFTASHPMHEYEFSPASGTVLEGVADAGEVMDGVTCLPVTATENEMTEVFWLYVSTATDTPTMPGEEPEPESAPASTQQKKPASTPTQGPAPKRTNWWLIMLPFAFVFLMSLLTLLFRNH